MFPVGAIFVPFPPKTGTNLLHPRPLPPIVEQLPVGNYLHDLDVYNLCCSYGNVRTHTLLEEKKHGPEHRWGVCCRGKGTRLRTQEGCLLLGNIPDHGHYRREAITGYAPGCGRSVLQAIRCASVIQRLGAGGEVTICPRFGGAAAQK